jgi:hypothetical protein
MRRLLMVALLLYLGASTAQTDPRRVRTLQIDDGQVTATQPHKGPVRAARPNEGPVRTAQPDEGRDGAEHPDEHLVLARQLVDLGPDSGGPSESAATCIPEPDTMRKEIAAAYLASPGEFHGISPQSAYWPEVEQAWHAYYVDRCAVQGDDSPSAIIARSYAANLSTVQLREVVAFQESPSGRAFIAATAKARQDLESAPAARTGQDADAASATFRQAMLRLKAKFERAPR